MKTVFSICIIVAFYALGDISVVCRAAAVSNTSETSNNSTSESSTVPQQDHDPEEEKVDNVVTLEFITDNKESAQQDISRRIPAAVVKILNQVKANVSDETNSTETKIRRRSADDQSSTGQYSEDGVKLVEIRRPLKDGKLRVPITVQDRAGNVLPAEQLKDKLEPHREEISADVGYRVDSIYVGTPDVHYALPTRLSIWELHWKMFLTVLILMAIAIVVLILCCLCFCCCRKRKQSKANGSKDKQLKKPIVDEEMVELTPVVPLHSAPAHQQPQHQEPNNVNDVPPSGDDDNGWIAPIDQFNADELDQPADVQISKL